MPLGSPYPPSLCNVQQSCPACLVKEQNCVNCNTYGEHASIDISNCYFTSAKNAAYEKSAIFSKEEDPFGLLAALGEDDEVVKRQEGKLSKPAYVAQVAKSLWPNILRGPKNIKRKTGCIEEETVAAEAKLAHMDVDINVDGHSHEADSSSGNDEVSGPEAPRFCPELTQEEVEK
ncbi:hypothetical protein AX14_005783 [Amanita brunnescens Koide BX004]|nr:hypothetical protein AX14_005783 [Amanita brunnescens Koide BX004]